MWLLTQHVKNQELNNNNNNNNHCGQWWMIVDDLTSIYLRRQGKAGEQKSTVYLSAAPDLRVRIQDCET